MSSTRNKRKRTETDARSEGRPKSREQRDAALREGKKLEVAKAASKAAAGTAANASKTSPGNNNQVDFIIGTVATRYQHAIGQDASVKERDAATGDSSLPIPSYNCNSNDRHKGPLSQNLSSATKPLYFREKGPHRDPSDDGLAHETNKSVRLQGLITHRSSLRRRIRFCAAAASEPLRHEIGESSYSKFELSAQKSGDTDEVSLFVQMTNSATLAAKRIRADNGANSDRRTSLSLRRGSSVGKRMNAALSSLAPGSSSNHSSSNLATVESNTKVPMNEKEQDFVRINMIENDAQVRLTSSVQQILPSSNGLVQHTNNPDNYSHRILIASQLEQSKQDQPDKPEAKSIDGNSSDNKGPELSPKISNGQEPNNLQSSSTNSDRLALPLHLRVITESLPQNRLTGRDMFSTKFSALRKQHDAIEARLYAYREQTQQNALILPMKNISIKNRLLSPRKTVSLPSRKLTHWDVLLQEMNWMATDFIEERKWKESVSRNISCAITSPSEKFPNSTRSLDDGNEKRREASSRDAAQGLHKDTQSDNGTENKLENVSTCSKLKEISTQTYPRNSQDGDEATRKVGNSIALLIATLGTAVMDTIDKQDFEQNKDSDSNHLNTRSLSGISRRKGRLQQLLPKNGSSISCGFRATLYGQESFSSLEISGFVDSFARIKGHQNDSIFQSFSSNFDSHLKMSLSREQKYVVDRVLNVWNQPTKPGIALSGGLCCGKTHTASVLMWQRRKRGPQLLICPTNSMIKWKFAIERLGDIRVLIYNLSTALSGDLSAEGEVLCKASDIILCEFELLDIVAGIVESSKKSFQTIILDCRCPSSFLASLGKPTVGTTGTSDFGLFDGSEYLLSVPWWDKLIDLSLQSNAAILLIEHSAENHWLHKLSKMPPRTKLETVASRAALLIGPRLFLCDVERMQRRVFSWARQHGKIKGRRKTASAQEVLEKATACLVISLNSSDWRKEKTGWELRRCKMEECQRSNYDACCIGVRGALSCGLAPLVTRSHESLCSVSQSLMLLRQQCIHGEVTVQPWNDHTHFTKGKRSHNTILKPVGIATENPAQLDSALAFRLIKGSAKLREMISILRFDCGVALADKLLLGCNILEHTMELSANKPRKVAILATLPIARRVVSLLLNALGIPHELVEPTWSECMKDSPLSSTKASIFSSHHQHMSACLNSSQKRGAALHPPLEIVVGCPAFLSGWNQGLVVENCDSVILVDDDWTGRGECVLSALLSRIQSHNFHQRKRCNFIRLICEDTIEEKLFSSDPFELSFTGSTHWPRDKSGFLSVPETISEALPLYNSAFRSDKREKRGFPLSRVIRLRHQPLSKTLLPSRTIPVVLDSTSKILFLPFAQMDSKNDDCEIHAELALMRVLCHEESVASSYYISHSDWDQAARNKNMHNARPPPCPASVTRPLITKRQDFFILLYLQSLCVANDRRLESAFSQGLKIMKSSLDESRHSATVSASRCSTDKKPSTSRNALFDCFRMMSIKSFSGSPVLHYAPLQMRNQEVEISCHGKMTEPCNQESIAIINLSIALQSCHNCYSRIYATSHVGNGAFAEYEGYEPFLFFPPLLKGEIHSGVVEYGQLPTLEVTKRKRVITLVELQSSKRLREMEPLSSAIPRFEDDSKSSFSSKAVNINLSAGESVELQQHTISHYHNSLPKRPATPEVSEGHVYSFNKSMPTAISAYMTTNQLDKRIVSRECRVFPVYDNTFETFENSLQHSSRKSQPCLDSVILFVKNPGIQNTGPTDVTRCDSNHARYSTDSHVPVLSPVEVEVCASSGAEEEEMGIKKRGDEKISHPQVALQVPLVESSIAGHTHSVQASVKLRKHSHQHQFYDFFLSRSISSGLSMFECVPYQVAVCQVEVRVTRTLEKRELHLGVELEVLVPCQQVESDVSCTRNGKKPAGWEIVGGSLNLPDTRGVLLEALKKGKSSIRSSIFGPRSGFLSSRGMNAPSVPKHQLGMSLPMGVKLSQAREEVRHSVWSQKANSVLCDLVKRYDQNWILIAKMMQKTLKVEIAKAEYYRTSEILWWKSAENCKKQCESISGESNDAVCPEGNVRSMRHSSFRKAPQETLCHSMGLQDSSVLAERKCMMSLDWSKSENDRDVAVEQQRLINADQTALQRQTNSVFSPLITSNMQRQIMPIAIIGVGNGPNQNQTAQLHPSHLQSVQESVTSHWSDGRTELWPLQIIDGAEKQYVASRAPSTSAKASSRSHVSSSTSPPAGRGHSYPRVPGNSVTSLQSASKLQASRMSGHNTSCPSSTLPPKTSVSRTK